MRSTAIRGNFREYLFLFTVVPFPETVPYFCVSVQGFTPSLGSIGPQFSKRARRTESWSCRRALFTRAPALQAGGALEKSQIVALHRSISVRWFGAVTTKSRG